MKSITTAELLVNGDRLNQSIATLASIGQLPQGGVKRIAYSKEDLEARNLIQQWMRELQMEVTIDAAGNIIGKYLGRNTVISAIATGSHIDTVPCGGHYDSAYGVLAGLEIVRVLQENQIRLERPIEVMEVLPNAANVVPGWVEMSLDIRDLSSLHIDSLLKQLRIHLEEIAVATNTQIRLNPCLHNEPALAEPYIQKAIALSCEHLNLSYTYLPSRASHDAQELAQIADMGMIFVPSKMGVSHDASEYTSPKQCIQGANILLQTLILLGKTS